MMNTMIKLNKGTINSIKQARERIKKGKFMTEEEDMKRLGLDV